jgi:hypothetical protein
MNETRVKGSKRKIKECAQDENLRTWKSTIKVTRHASIYYRRNMAIWVRLATDDMFFKMFWGFEANIWFRYFQLLNSSINADLFPPKLHNTELCSLQFSVFNILGFPSRYRDLICQLCPCYRKISIRIARRSSFFRLSYWFKFSLVGFIQ